MKTDPGGVRSCFCRCFSSPQTNKMTEQRVSMIGGFKLRGKKVNHLFLCLLLPSLPHHIFPQTEAFMDPLAPLPLLLTWSALRTLWTLFSLEWGRGERETSSWWDAARQQEQQQQAHLETGLSAARNLSPPLLQAMTRQCINLLTPLVLLLLAGLADLSLGSAGEHEDYYMQEMLTREQYNQVQVQEKPVASTPDRHDHPRQSKKSPKGKPESNKKTEKNSAPTKSGKKKKRGSHLVHTAEQSSDQMIVRYT